MNRRTFLCGLTLGALAPLLAAGAQPTDAIPRIGVLRPGASTDPADRASVGAFLAGLQEAGYVPGRNVRVEIRYADWKFDRLPRLARELAALPVAAIMTANPYATRAVLEATRAVPIVVALDYETDPVVSGWVGSIARPGGNLTGLFLDQPEMSAKLLQLLKEAAPRLTKVAVLWDAAIAQAQFEATKAAAQRVGLALTSLGVTHTRDLPGAFETAARERAGGLVVLTSPLFTGLNRQSICALALKHHMPGITLFTNFPQFGLLMAYGPDQPDAFRRAGSEYVARILRGAQPTDLPVQRPQKFELVVNRKTANALGLMIPQSLLIRADQVIE